ncbi:putative alpha protein [Botrytis fragariae]|uniref:Putative alpha protein n=1 Tax=Botrytis fragariae TaxID=1964551 RepID=A0A8H6B1R0_9HELO|nr:putative alpha protein [Botrytis fragariae]KAF5877794.1 putative alpha protein [Botrytis fragariae]
MKLLMLVALLSSLTLVRSKAVFAHFMVDNTASYSTDDWEDDINQAQIAHTDAFALNIANNDSTIAARPPTLFSIAGSKGFKLFFSFDYAGNGATEAAYYFYNGQAFVSTFEGVDNTQDWPTIIQDTGYFFIPSWSSLGAKAAMATGVPNGLFREMTCGSTGGHKSGHYIGPNRAKAWSLFDSSYGKAQYNYADDFPHDGWRQFLPYVIEICKTGAATITEEGLSVCFRPQPASGCATGGTTGNTASQLQIQYGPAEIVQDEIFFTALLGSTATVKVTVGGVDQAATWTRIPDGNVGLYHGNVTYKGTGPVIVTVLRDGTRVAQVSGGSISTVCTDSIENWNAWVGSDTGPSVSAVAPAYRSTALHCVRGIGPGDYAELCALACTYDYCPTVCTCKYNNCPNEKCICTSASFTENTAPTYSTLTGYPADKDGQDYGLCEWACNRGFCPFPPYSSTAPLADIGEDVTSFPSYTVSKLTATSKANSVALLAYWTTCEYLPQCAPGFRAVGYGHGKVHDADRNAYTADGCTGGSKGFNRAFCVETDVSLGQCNWRGTATSCSQTCKAGEFLLTQNTHIAFAKAGCKAGHFSSLCCEKIEVPSKDLVTCPYTNLNNVITGGHGPVVRAISNSKAYLGGSQVTAGECIYNPVGNALSFRLNQIVANGAILNNIPGTWEAHVGGVADFKPTKNKPPQSQAKNIDECDTWLADYHTTSLSVTSTVTINCDEDNWPQACAHYNSVESVMTLPVITCPWQNQGSKDRPAPSRWNSQHHSVWWPFVDSFRGPLSCQRDEYPPLYFMPTGHLSDWRQSIRLLPSRQNNLAGKKWRLLCQSGSIADGTCQSTITTLQKVRAMSIAFDTRYLRQNDDMLSVNPCSINALLTSDRGFVLLANDPWYRPWRSAKPADYSSNKIPSTLLNNLKRSVQKRNDNGLNHEQIEALARYEYHFVSIPSSLTDLKSDFITGEKHRLLDLLLALDVGNTTRRANDEDVFTILQILGNEFLEDDCEYDEFHCSGPTMVDQVQTATWDPPVTSSVVLASSSSMTLTGAIMPAATGPKPVLTVATSSEKPIPTKIAEGNKKGRGGEDGAVHKHAHFNHRYSHRHHRKSL